MPGLKSAVLKFDDLMGVMQARRLAGRGLQIVGYTKQAALWMEACDVLLTKPGGLTSTEAAVKNVPLVLTAPILRFTSICSPVFGLIGCLIPAYLVYQVPFLAKYKGLSLKIIIFTGILLIISPFLAFS